MKKLLSLIVALLVVLSVNPALARRTGTTHFRTYEVVQVTEKVIVLKAQTGEKVEADKSLRPELKVGDRVRYERSQGRFGVTIPAGGPDEPAAEEE